MADAPSREPKDETSRKPAPEVLQPRTDKESKAPQAAPKQESRFARAFAPRHHQSYRLSHRATFIGLAVVAVILALNAGVIVFVLKGQSGTNPQANQGVVTVSQAALDKLGVNQSDAGKLGVQLVVNPDAKFNGDLTVGGDTSIGGQLKLNSKFSASDASLTQLEAGKTSLESVEVNGDGTLTNLTARQDLTVGGTSRLQGPTVMSQLLTVNSNANKLGSLSVGGTLSVGSFHAGSLVVDGTVTVGGHIITSGRIPGLARGPALRGTDSISNSGNDVTGSVAVNIGAGSVSGCVATVSFRSAYSNIPHVVITPVGYVQDVYLCGRSAGGFTIGVGSQSGSVVFDYIVEQ
jgi:hypothetical protein